MKIKQSILFFILTIFALSNLGLTIPHKIKNEELAPASKETSIESELSVNDCYCVAEVIKRISDREEELPSGNKQRTQDLLLKILNGVDKNKTRITNNVIPDNPGFSIIGQVGKRYLVNKTENLETGNEDYYLIDYHRENLIWILAISFLAVLIIIGGLKGL